MSGAGLTPVTPTPMTPLLLPSGIQVDGIGDWAGRLAKVA